MLENKYLLLIEGKNPKNFIRSLIKNKINLYQIKKRDNAYEIVVSEVDYQKIRKIKTIYKITLLSIKGPKYWKQQLLNKKLFFSVLLLGLGFLLFLTNVIFSVEVIHTKKEIRDLVTEELRTHGIERLRFCVSFEKKESIRSAILDSHKDKLEWLEIERVGTKYIVRVEERKKNTKEEEYTTRNIIAKKDGLITKVEAEMGEIVVKKNQYVKKGDILISGTIKKDDEVKSLVPAKGTVFAETWYKVTVAIPTYYHEEKLTGATKNILGITFLGKNFNLFDFKPYQTKKVTKNILLKNSLFSFQLEYNQEQELDIIDHTYSQEEALQKANELAKEKVKATLGVNDRIIGQKDLKIIAEDSKIVVEVFLKVEEDITSYGMITENNIENDAE